MEEVLGYLNNYFFQFGESGSFEIINGQIKMENEFKLGQYILIEGSSLNEGVHLITSVISGSIGLTDIIDETFDGIIYALAIPRKLIDISERIITWKEKNPPSVYTSESFGAYSYNKGTGRNGKIYGWEDAFSQDLRQYRKIYDGKRHVPIFERTSEVQ